MPRRTLSASARVWEEEEEEEEERQVAVLMSMGGGSHALQVLSVARSRQVCICIGWKHCLISIVSMNNE